MPDYTVHAGAAKAARIAAAVGKIFNYADIDPETGARTPRAATDAEIESVIKVYLAGLVHDHERAEARRSAESAVQDLAL